MCQKTGHTSAQCWTAHPELIPEGIQKRKTAAMMARRGRGSSHNPCYQFQGMALTYTRPATPQGAARRSARAASTIAKKTAQRKVQFNTGGDVATRAHERYPTETEESEKAHLPQPFLHVVPTSSLEPGTTNLHHPPTYVFLELPLDEAATARSASTL